jgi:tetratricopeptide (TPR) repeat protein
MLAGTVLLLTLTVQAPADVAAPSATTAAEPARPASVDPALTGPAGPHLAAGLAAFKARRFAAARSEFEKAVAADPQSAAAAFYLGYTHYKLGEPTRRLTADKEKAKELFARAFSLDPAFRPTWGR